MLEVKDVSKTYIVKKNKGIFKREKIKKLAVNHVSLELPKGKIIGVLGENGAGKTTLIKMMTTLLLSDSGVITIDGEDINKNLVKTRKRINIISGGEKNLYWRLTAVENLVYFASLYGISKSQALPKIEYLLKEIGLWESRDVPVEQFSKGMKQRLQIAKGLINDPDYLFLDEPTLGLDVSVALELRKKLKEIAEVYQTGILLTTHYMAEAEELCDYLYILQKGEIILSGTKEEVFSQLSMIKSLHVTLTKVLGSDSQEFLDLKAIYSDTEYTENDGQAFLSIPLEEASLQEVMETLYRFKIEISELKLIEPSLEDVMLKSKDWRK